MKRWLPLLLAAWLSGCASAPPQNPANACSIFQEKEGWYASALQAQQRWGAPVSAQLAVINQESGFVEDARPPRYRFLGFIPLWRPSSAYGYGQAKDETWDGYRNQSGKYGAERDEFGDVADFIGWHFQQSQARLGIAKHDAYRQYLAYHEGLAGYRRGTYAGNAWLLRAARRVASIAERYARQLAGCQANLERRMAARED